MVFDRAAGSLGSVLRLRVPSTLPGARSPQSLLELRATAAGVTSEGRDLVEAWTDAELRRSSAPDASTCLARLLCACDALGEHPRGRGSADRSGASAPPLEVQLGEARLQAALGPRELDRHTLWGALLGPWSPDHPRADEGRRQLQRALLGILGPLASTTTQVELELRASDARGGWSLQLEGRPGHCTELRLQLKELPVREKGELVLRTTALTRDASAGRLRSTLLELLPPTRTLRVDGKPLAPRTSKPWPPAQTADEVHTNGEPSQGPGLTPVRAERAQLLLGFLGPGLEPLLRVPRSSLEQHQLTHLGATEEELLERLFAPTESQPSALGRLAERRPDLRGLRLLAERAGPARAVLTSLVRPLVPETMAASTVPCLGTSRALLIREDLPLVREPSGWADSYALRSSFDRALGLGEAEVERGLIVGEPALRGRPAWAGRG